MITRRNRRTFKGEIFASENQNSVRLNGDTELVSEGYWNLENEATLLKWDVAGPMISDMLETAHLFETKPNKVYEHREDTKLFQDKFLNDKKVFKETLENLGNPFLEQEPQLVHVILKRLLDQKKPNCEMCKIHEKSSIQIAC